MRDGPSEARLHGEDGGGREGPAKRQRGGCGAEGLTSAASLRLVALGRNRKVVVVEQDLLAAPERHGGADGDLGGLEAVGERRRRRRVVQDAGGKRTDLGDKGVGEAFVVGRAVAWRRSISIRTGGKPSTCRSSVPTDVDSVRTPCLSMTMHRLSVGFWFTTTLASVP